MAPSGLPVVWNLHHEVETISYENTSNSVDDLQISNGVTPKVYLDT